MINSSSLDSFVSCWKTLSPAVLGELILISVAATNGSNSAWHCRISSISTPDILTISLLELRDLVPFWIAFLASFRPRPGKPSALIKAFSSFLRKTLGLGFPILGSFVTVPVTKYPNPKELSPGINLQFLSYPAARPTGFFNFMPANSVSKLKLSNPIYFS